MKKTKIQNPHLIKKTDETFAAGLEKENDLLRSRLEELEETLNAIRTGSIDALVVSGPEGEKIYSLAGAEHPYRVMVETMGEGALSLAHDGTILYANRSFAKLLQISLEKIVGSNINQYLSPEDCSILSAVLKRTRKNSKLEISLSHRQRKLPVYLSITRTKDGRDLGIFSVVATDLTHQKNEELMRRHSEQLQKEIEEREKTEWALRKSEERFRSVLDNSKDLIYRQNVKTGRYEYVSPSCEAITGYSASEVLSMDRETASTFINPEDMPAMRLALAHLNKSGRAEAEYRWLNRNGEYRWFSNHMSLVRDSSRDPIYRDGIIRDITDRKQTIVDLEHRTDELASAYADLESFSYSVSHDLRSPLRAIDGFAKIILKEIGGTLDPESLRKFNVIRANTEKMSNLIDGLLNLSRASRATLSKAKFDIKSAAMDIWEELRAGNPNRKMELKIHDLPPASGDRSLLRQVLSNLLGNAVKFTRDKDLALIEITGHKSGDFSTFCIKDNGTGFDMNYYDNLFGVFRRLHSEREFEGTGIGLAIAKKIIQKHGGQIWAEGKPGEGAAFYFTLPG